MKTKVGIIGGAGYTAGELIRVLLFHPEVEISWVQSDSQQGKKVHEVHRDLVGDTQLTFADHFQICDIYFLCKGHGESVKVIEKWPQILNSYVIDLSQDHRLTGDHDFVYGLPELNKERISVSKHVANPGCFASCIQLAMLPAISSGLVHSDIHVSGITGSTGAGQSFSATSHFSWRHSNASTYKTLNHQHLSEIGETFSQIDDQFKWDLNFVPYRGAFTRGIITTSYFSSNVSFETLKDLYRSYYEAAAYSFVVESNPDVKQVVNTNKCLIFPTLINQRVVIVSVLDNLLKGAVGQAVQNMNIMLGFNEKSGLNLKPIAF